MLEVTSAEHVDGYRIRIRFNNSDEGIVDLSDALWGPVFTPLKDMTRFKAFHICPVLHTVRWGRDADLAPEYLHDKMLEQSQASDRLLK